MFVNEVEGNSTASEPLVQIRSFLYMEMAETSLYLFKNIYTPNTKYTSCQEYVGSATRSHQNPKPQLAMVRNSFQNYDSNTAIERQHDTQIFSEMHIWLAFSGLAAHELTHETRKSTRKRGPKARALREGTPGESSSKPPKLYQSISRDSM